LILLFSTRGKFVLEIFREKGVGVFRVKLYVLGDESAVARQEKGCFF
jgi:hypothetical protein